MGGHLDPYRCVSDWRAMHVSGAGEKNLKKALVINNIASTKFANVRTHSHLPAPP